MHQSISTIDSPEFLNLQPLDINPLMSSCEIKVLYIGKNRNNSYITKDVASEMAKTLRGAPIVGYFKSEKGDFADHGERVILDDEGIKFDCLTKPYGFVSPDAEVWFQKFEDTDEFGNITTREYLMTTGYLWTGQYNECKLAVDEGRPHSMELDKETLDGNWSYDSSSNMDFFIINDAIFSKLCILGEDIEPCFEGSNIKAPQVSASFTKINNDFKQTLFSMMNELKFALEGGKDITMEEPIIDTTIENQDSSNQSEIDNIDNNTEVQEENLGSNSIEEVASDFVEKKKEEKTSEEDKKEEETSEDESDKQDDEEKDKEDKYSLLEEKYQTLEQKYFDLKTNYDNLISFKLNIEKEQKEKLIEEFYMLADEDKKDVITNIDKYSLDEIESKLSVICRRKKVNFGQEITTNKEDSVVTYNLNNTISESVPAYISALRHTRDNRNN
jgi:hypothetical protein